MRFTLQLSVLAGLFAMGILPSYATTPISSDADTKLQEEDSGSFSLLQTAQTPPLTQPENLQPNPNRDRFLQPQTPSLPAPQTTQTPVIPTPTPEPTTNTVPIQVKRIEVIGSTVLSAEQLQKITKPLEGRTVTFNELTNAVEAINKLYLEQGYTSSRAVLEAQTIADGVVKIRAVEGSIERIEVEGTRRLNQNYVRSRVKLGAGTPLKYQPTRRPITSFKS